jgi:hypothetical protein
MEKEDVLFLGQLITSLEELELKLEKYYKEEDHENFIKIKRMMLKVQREISDMIK